VFRRDPGPVRYTVLAKELDVASPPTIIDLTNNVPFDFTAGPGAALTNFFHFAVTSSPPSIHFQLYNLTGNGDLTVQTNAPPFAPPFFQTSQQPGVNPELITIYTNSAQTNFNNTVLTNLALDWYLGVPNYSTNQIAYTILAVIDTNSVFPAFPGAEGAGAGTAGGGRLGLSNTVYHVTQLGDSGAGSLRDAVSSTNRTIVFDVSGTIDLQSRLLITNSYLTIAGQTAPGGGITIAGWETAVTNAHDVIIRYVRFRPGDTNGFDALRFISVSNVIADHVSAEWSPLHDTAALDANNLTVQWSVIADSLFATNTPNAGTLLRFGDGALTLHHNLYANNYAGNPHLDDNLSLDFVNNVIYGWGTNAGTSFDPTNNPAGFTNRLNYVCNYLIANSNSFAPTIAFRGGSTNTWIYQTNNFIDSDTNGILNGANTGWAMFTNQFTQIGQPFPLPPVSTDEAFRAYEKVLDFAGLALMARDSVDAEIVTEVRDQTGTIISTPPASALSDMVAWWKAEGNGLDSVGGNNGAPTAGITYTNGEVGQAFVFDGATTSYIPVAATPSLNGIGVNGSGFTIECWVEPASTASGPILEWDSATVDGLQFWIQSGSQLFANIQDTSGNSHSFFTGLNTLNSTNFQHVALTYDKSSGNAFIYRNGVIVASANFGSIIPQTTYSNLRIGLRSASSIGTYAYTGLIDELSVYKRALSSSEIASIYNAGSAGKQSLLTSQPALPYLDTDRDGIPDFWETTFGQFPTNVSNFLPSTHDIGYTDLEEYINWLGAPHALTITNTPVGVDLMKLCGNTGNLSFAVTNSVNGLVYLTNVLSYTNSLGVGITVTNTGPFSNSIAVFTPTNNAASGTNFYGYAAFDFTVTNNDTHAYFGPVTVSVVVSAVPIVYASLNTNVPPMFVNGTPTNQTINELTLLTVTNTATLVNTNLTLTYQLISPPAGAVIDTNGIITWTPSEAQGPGVYTITTVASDNSVPPLSATNSFTVTVNEVNLAPFWPTNVPSQTNYTIPATTTLVVTNTAQDSDIPVNPLTYTLSVSPAVTNAVISTNGIITWTPTLAQVGLFTFTTIVTDTNPPAVNATSLSATNTFTVLVTAVAAPFVFSQPAQAVTGASALLPGMVTPNGLPTTAWFEWGTTTNYGTVTPLVNVGAGYNVVYTTNQISGLLTNVPYHFRLVASNAVSVVYGFDQILDEANVVVWGADYLNQANVPGGLSNVVAIAGAYDHSLALKNNGTVAAWGDNTFGQASVPPGLNNVLAVAGGEYYSMALKNSGLVAAWGANILTQTNVPPGLNNVVTIAGGQYSSLALKNNGAVVVWGANFFGLTNVPASVSNAVAIAGGGFHNLAVKNDGTVIAWGDNSDGQLNVPGGLTNVVAIAAGSYHSLALKSDGTVVAWGDNSSGQTNVPAGLNHVVAVAAGGFNSLALRSDGRVVAWGDNSAGQSSVPVNLTNSVAISSGYFHSLALTPQSIASLTNPVVLNLTNGVAQTNTVLAGGTTYYRVNVPTNADFATNSLLFAFNGPLNIWFTTNTPPTTGAINDSLLLAGATNGISILNTTSAPPRIAPGGTYYLGVQNTNNFPVTYGIEVDFHLVAPTNIIVPISSIVYTNIGGTNGFLLTWFAPSNDLFQVQWTTSLAPATWTTFTNPPFVSYNTNFPASAVNAQFNFFDDASQTGGTFGPSRFYRLLLFTTPVAPTNTAPVFIGTPANQTINPLATLTVTNAATDSDVPVQTLTYTLLSSPTNATINSTNGVITWTPTLAQAGTSNTIVTVVTDNGTPNLSATNSFAVIVNPIPAISSVTFTTIGGMNGFLVKWYAPTNSQFQVQWTASLPPIGWQTFSNIVIYTGPATPTNGLFTFFDDGSQTGGFGPQRYYRLILLGSAVSANIVTLPAQSNLVVNVSAAVTVTNTATDSNTNAILTYSLVSPPVNASISTNGVITWTNAVPAGLAGRFTTIVTDNGVPSASATNTFTVFVAPFPAITNIVATATNLTLRWSAPTNDQFQVQWSTNLAVIPWNTFPNIITSPTGLFTFTDTNAPLFMKFYRLLLLP
jgi:hypothetical protein